MEVLFSVTVVILVAAVVLNLILVGAVLWNDRKSATNRLFFLLGVVVAVWLVVMYVSIQPFSEEVSLWLIRLTIFLATVMSMLLYLLARTLPERRIKTGRSLQIILGVTGAVMVVTLSPCAFAGVKMVDNFPSPVPGAGLIVFGAYVVWASVAAIYVLGKRLRMVEVREEKKQLGLMIVGVLIMYGLLILTILLPVALLRNNFFVPFYPVYTLVFTGLTAYAIVRHGLFEIKIFATQALALVLVIVLFAKLFVSVDLSEMVVDAFVLAVATVFGYLLVKSVRKEVEQREKLQELTQKLRELDKVKNEFISIAAHELRAPLTAIRGYVSMILDGDAGQIPEQATDFLKDCMLSSERMIRLVNNMLDVSRIEEGRIEYQENEVDLTEILKQAYSEFKLEAERKELEFKLEIAEGAADRVYVDKDRLHEVVVNFLSNAFKYTEKGGVILKFSNPNSDYAKVEVIDSGMGISKEEQGKLFRKFYRVKSIRGKTMGSGLGLYISKLLIEKFGGKIGVVSEIGKGSNFWFELPVRTKFEKEDAKA